MKIINLLPKNKQLELKYEKIYYSLERFSLLFVCTILVVFASQVGTKVFLKMQLNRLVQDTAIAKANGNKDENAKVKSQIRLVNNQIADFATLAVTAPQWSRVLEALSPLVPNDVAIQTFTADNLKKQVSISGFSKNRDGVINLYNKISGATDKFKNINYPLENLSKPQDVPFHFTFEIQDKLLYLEDKK